MFGYVMPLKAELKVREYDTFRAYYCGLCREIGKKSAISKLTLTYDMTFLALLLSSLYNEKETTQKQFCPFKMKRVMAITQSPYLEYAADMNIILSSRKLFDNYIDNKNYLYYIASKVIKSRSITDSAKDKIKKIDFHLNEIRKLEKAKCGNIDEVGHNFAEITAEIFSITDNKEGKILRHLGYNLGKWIYTIDAYDDIIDDIKNKKYNPCLYRYEYSGTDPQEFKNSIKDNIQFTLFKCLDEISKAFELLSFKKNKCIVENIIYLGLERKTTNVLERSYCNEKSIQDFRYKGRCFTGGDKAGI